MSERKESRYKYLQRKLKRLRERGKIETTFNVNGKKDALEERYDEYKSRAATKCFVKWWKS